MSVAIATMGMFIPAVGTGLRGGGSSGPVFVTEEKKKPIITIINIKEENTLSKNIIEVKSVNIGD